MVVGCVAAAAFVFIPAAMYAYGRWKGQREGKERMAKDMANEEVEMRYRRMASEVDEGLREPEEVAGRGRERVDGF